MNRKISNLYKGVMKAVFILLLSWGIALANLEAERLPGGTFELESFQIDGNVFVKSSSLAKFLDGKETIDFLNNSGKTEFGEFTLEYSLFSPFVKAGDEVYNVYAPVQFRDGAFLLPIRYLVPVLNRASKLEFSYDGGKLTVSPAIFNVTGVNASQKMNGLLLEVYLKDDLKYDIVKTDDNWLLVTIANGKVDSAAFARESLIKAVYQVNTYQFDGSCQVSFRLRPQDFTFTSKVKADPLRIQLLIRGEGFSESSAPMEEKPSEALSDNPIDVIVIDPGHGGEDNGAVGAGGSKEKDVVLKIAKHLFKLLKDDKRFKPIMTRQDDVFVPLSGRTALANSVGGDIFISIHANAAKNKKASGIITFFLADAKTDDARATATLENSSIRFENVENQKQYTSDLDFTLRDMMQSEFQRESMDLADIIQKAMSTTTGLGTRGVDQAGFFVLDKAYMPSVLVETAFISNARDEKKLISDDFQKKTARAIYNSIVAFKERYEGQKRTSR